MNVELRRRTDVFSAPIAAPAATPAPAPANDNAARQRGTGAQRRRVLIYRPAKSAMTSGRASTKRWILQFEAQSAPFIESLMGWIGSADPMAHLRLSFPNREAAVAYAQRQGLDYEVRDAAKPARVQAAAAKSPGRPMPLWPLEWLQTELNGVPLADHSAASRGATLAA